MRQGPRKPVGPTLAEFDENTSEVTHTGMMRLPLPMSRRTIPVVRVVAGPGMLSYAEIPEEGAIIVGREPGCGVTIDHPSVSRRHAEFSVDDDDAITVRDLGSTNGTWKDGRRITEREIVEPGHRIEVGQVSLRIERLGDQEIAHLARMAANIEAATRDPLTRLATRRWLDDDLPRVVAEHDASGRPLSALFIDIDHFKTVNDTYGHPVGDEVLRAVSGIVQDQIRGTDVAVRYGGEEILVILPGTSADITAHVAERLRVKIATHPWANHGLGDRIITVSGGISRYLPHEGIAPWLERADRALYEAKHTGRNRTCRL